MDEAEGTKLKYSSYYNICYLHHVHTMYVIVCATEHYSSKSRLGAVDAAEYSGHRLQPRGLAQS